MNCFDEVSAEEMGELEYVMAQEWAAECDRERAEFWQVVDDVEGIDQES